MRNPQTNKKSTKCSGKNFTNSPEIVYNYTNVLLIILNISVCFSMYGFSFYFQRVMIPYYLQILSNPILDTIILV